MITSPPGIGSITATAPSFSPTSTTSPSADVTPSLFRYMTPSPTWMVDKSITPMTYLRQTKCSPSLGSAYPTAAQCSKIQSVIGDSLWLYVVLSDSGNGYCGTASAKLVNAIKEVPITQS